MGDDATKGSIYKLNVYMIPVSFKNNLNIFIYIAKTDLEKVADLLEIRSGVLLWKKGGIYNINIYMIPDRRYLNICIYIYLSKKAHLEKVADPPEVWPMPGYPTTGGCEDGGQGGGPAGGGGQAHAAALDTRDHLVVAQPL